MEAKKCDVCNGSGYYLYLELDRHGEEQGLQGPCICIDPEYDPED